MKDEKKKLTNNAGAPVSDNQNVMTAGPRGPQLLQDAWFLEKLANFDREVIPERRMHAKGSGVRMELLQLLTTLLATPRQSFSLRLEKRQNFLHVSQRWPVNAERQTLSAISVDLP